MANIIKNILSKTPFSKRSISKIQTRINKNEATSSGLLNRWKEAWSNVRQMSSKKASKTKGMADPLDHATGIEKKEIQSYIDGKFDPFHIGVVKRGEGTAENPTLIPSAFNMRLVGCICEENRFVNFMWLEKGIPKRCECGHWFRLKEVGSFI